MMALARPTMMVAVPELYETAMAGARAEAGDSGPRRRLVDWSLGVVAAVQAAYNRGERPRCATACGSSWPTSSSWAGSGPRSAGRRGCS